MCRKRATPLRRPRLDVEPRSSRGHRTIVFAVSSTPDHTRLILLRHGESTWNTTRLIQGHADQATLTDRGREQALQVVNQLRGFAISRAVSSDLRRARETAAIVCRALDIEFSLDTSLRERNFGQIEGCSLDVAIPALTGIERNIVVDDGARPEGGESLADVYRRGASFVDDVVERYRGQTVLVVTHGGVIRTISAYCHGATMQGRQWVAVDNCSVWPLDPPRSSSH